MPAPPDPADPLAAALARLAPAPADLATPDFLFTAGRASEARRVAFWRQLCLAQAALGCVAAAAVAAWAATPRTPSADTPVSPASAEVTPPRESAPTPDAAGDGPTLDERIQALRLRNDILALGLSALPEPVPLTRPNPTPLEDDR